MGNCLTKGKRSEENPPAASSSTELPKENPPAASSSTELPNENPPAASSLTELPMENAPAALPLTKPPEENPATASSSGKLPEELQECIRLFKEIKDTGDIDELIHMAQQIPQRKKQQNNPENASTSSTLTHGREEESSMWTSITKTGFQFLNYLNKSGSSEALHQGVKVAAETLQQAGQINSIVGGLSTIAFVLHKFENMRDNQPECRETLGDLIDLAGHLRNLKKMIPEEEEKFTKAIQLIVEGSITCIRQLEDNMLFRFIKSSVNSENLTSLRKRINELYPNLELSAIIDIRKDIPTYLPLTKPIYPEKAVGIEMRVNELVDILRTKGQSSLAVVIYGFGGLGKTTIAEAVVSKMDLKDYKYTSLEVYQEREKNDFTRSQQQILKDCFPNYNGGKSIVLRDCKDGRGHMMEAFKCGKPIFLFIDNALRLEDLKELLPQDLGCLPQGSRILITTRLLAATDMFEGQLNLVRRPWPLQPLLREDALKVLFKDLPKPATIKDEDLNRILRICSGVPLVLKIVGAQLHKHSYQVDRCTNILERLENGETIKEEKLSERLVDFVYGELEEYSKEALLDICCFFSKWNRQDVEYIEGAMAVSSLVEAGLITSTPKPFTPLWEELIVHDIIRAKGQDLAKGNRILDVQSLYKAADEKRLNQIKGVWLVNEKSEYVIEERHLYPMRNSLRILVLGEGMQVSAVNQMRFEELKFLHVSGDIPQLPVKLEELKKLRVFHGPFFTEGEVSLCKLPESLLSMKVIRQFHSTECTNFQMTGVPLCPLEKLDFSKLVELPKLPEGFNKLVAMKILILDDIEKMWELPEQICQLPALKVLSMRRCQDLTCLPKSFGQLTTLTDLNLYGCLGLQKFPDTLEQLTALTDLNISYCTKLEVLPDSLGQLTALGDLNLSWCYLLKALPNTLGQLTSLRRLNLFECFKLQALPQTLGQLTSLTYLNLTWCAMLEALPDNFGQLKALEVLNLSWCTMLEALPATFGQLTALRDLNLSGCGMLEALPTTFGQLTALRNLNLSWCAMLEALPDTFGQLTALENLNLSECEKLQTLPDNFKQLIALKNLNLSKCYKLETFPNTFEQLTSLQNLQCSNAEINN